MQTDDVIQMKMGQEQVKGPGVGIVDETVQFVKAVAGVENKVKGFRPDEGADGVSHARVIPAVGAQKNDFHIFPPLLECRSRPCMQKGGMIILSHHEKVNACRCCLPV